MKTITLLHKDSNTRKELTQAEIKIGRSKDCDFVVLDRTVSKHHDTIFQDEKSISIEDHSTNGTTIGKLKMKKGQKVLVSNRDIIRLGKNYTLKILINDDNTSGKPAPIDQTPLENEEVLPMPSAAELEKDIANINHKTKH